MIPTDEQVSIYEAVAENRNVMVNAVAGSGKTTTAVSAARYAVNAGRKVRFTAFNKHIADHLQTKLPVGATASTMHSLGLSIIRQKTENVRIADNKVEPKYAGIFQRLFPQCFRQGRSRAFVIDRYAATIPAVELCRTQLLDPEDDDDYGQIETDMIGDGHEIDSGLRERVIQVLKAGRDMREVIDFTDMVYLPVYHGWTSHLSDVMFVDECQDLNPAQQALVLACAPVHVCVGDPRQAIMGFAGADVQSFNTLRRRLTERGEVVDRTLSICWRCPTSGIELASRLVPTMKASPTAKPGSVNEVKLPAAISALRPGDLFVCRRNGPLMSVALQLIRFDVPVLVRGKNVGDGLVSLIRRLTKGSDSLAALMHALRGWRKEQLEQLDPEEDGEQVEAITDRFDCLAAVADSSKSVSQMIGRIEGLFSDGSTDGKVLLSSVHRSKGLEANSVTVLDPGMMPRGFGETRQQDENLLYVALTRHKNNLTLVDDTVRRTLPTADWLTAIANGAGAKSLTAA